MSSYRGSPHFSYSLDNRVVKLTVAAYTITMDFIQENESLRFLVNFSPPRCLLQAIFRRAVTSRWPTPPAQARRLLLLPERFQLTLRSSCPFKASWFLAMPGGQ
ncbi:hypothetical protein DY000_02007106 [Brassica cretica]|uniref:Uncharacterized protein n=1 Tax=Brassica cretica TaxID=69181 RepID=A0ABQ7BUY5_BRACR|nr:hypothetical protein DY000_02007106 [Brassica cretica]